MLDYYDRVTITKPPNNRLWLASSLDSDDAFANLRPPSWFLLQKGPDQSALGLGFSSFAATSDDCDFQFFVAWMSPLFPISA